MEGGLILTLMDCDLYAQWGCLKLNILQKEGAVLRLSEKGAVATSGAVQTRHR